MSRGGYRPGSGPAKGSTYKKKGKPAKSKKKNGEIPDDIKDAALKANLSPLEYMLQVMNDPLEDGSMRARMATAAAPYCHPRKGEGQGKKADLADRAKAAGSGRFAPSKPPKLERVK